LLARRQRELDLVRGRYGEVLADVDLTWLEVVRFPIPPGWTTSVGRVVVLIPPGYPATPPDNFYLEDAISLANGGVVGNASPGQVVLGRPWRLFSYHVEPGTWRPYAEAEKGHNLLTYLAGVEGRLMEAS
jgi:Prokaryotic E2 family E